MRTLDALRSCSLTLSLSTGGVLLSQRKRAAVSAGGFIRRGMQMSHTVSNPSFERGGRKKKGETSERPLNPV